MGLFDSSSPMTSVPEPTEHNQIHGDPFRTVGCGVEAMEHPSPLLNLQSNAPLVHPKGQNRSSALESSRWMPSLGETSSAYQWKRWTVEHVLALGDCVGQPHSSLHRHGHLEVPSQLPPISTEPTHRSIGRCGEMCQGDHRLAIPVGGFKGSGVAFNRWRIGRDDGYPGKKCTD